MSSEMCHRFNMYSGSSLSNLTFIVYISLCSCLSFDLNLLEVCVSLRLVGFDIQKIPLVRFDWLSGQVAMVKAVIKAIKAAGVGLNGSSDCSCCHKLNRKGESVRGRMRKT